ncbi:MAG: hypothetical protein Q7W30_03730 [Coriobacteriia bacterium]|nr:hypothetical protein [Coriobacteriia bacterium]
MDDETSQVVAADEPAAPPARRSGWDFTLMVVTTALLGALGVQSLAGTLYSWWVQRSSPEWGATPAFGEYIALMNAIAAPLLVGLFVVMGLCVPKRLFSRGLLVAVSVLMVALGLGVWLVTGEATTGMAAYLVGAGLIQVAVVVMTAGGARSLTYLTEGRLTTVGSGILHLGFIAFAYVVVAMQGSDSMLPVFWVAAVLCLGGTALSFYAGPLARALVRRTPEPSLTDDEAPTTP